jgi:hypothetical protein
MAEPNVNKYVTFFSAGFNPGDTNWLDEVSTRFHNRTIYFTNRSQILKENWGCFNNVVL